MKAEYKGRTYHIERYPKTTDRSLKPWSAADELLLSYMNEQGLDKRKIALYNDRFGYLTCLLHELEPVTVVNYASQLKACTQNVEANDLSDFPFLFPLEQYEESISLALLKIPKSHDLFEFQLQQIVNAMEADSIALCGFMTKHFSPNLLKIAKRYFEVVEQSLAVKKARLLILKQPKKVAAEPLMRTLKSQSGHEFHQYYGVFSGNNIDYATEFLMQHLEILPSDDYVMDLASGNGVLAHAVRQLQPNAEIHLVDDSYLAIDSSKLNLGTGNLAFFPADKLDAIPENSYDVVVSNPPFHFDYETNIDVTLHLFKGVKRVLFDGGNFQLVANRHLPYKPHLEKLFDNVYVVAQNDKFIVYRCS